ncbi:UNC5C-like protein [Branchiostoma floridae]|uniref:UNC5C-like protein n=1 Tax=Branchiostoma floridae TaxID=7739 RepID=A0A9J7LW64_BRAFL|nr:UNC5C-like protein [Branchiostoma floridae]
MEDDHNIDRHQANVPNETLTSIPHEDTTDEDRQRDLELFNKLSLDRDKLIREGTIPLRVQLQTNFSSNNFASGVFDHTGGHLSLPRHDINLFIPPGAIEDGRLQTIHIFVPPSMHRGKPAPVVHCGPTGTTFLDHVILSFPVDPNYDKIVPKFTNTEVGSEEDWKPLLEDDDAASIVQNGKCTLFLSHFTGFGADATEEGASPDKKMIRVGAFAAKHTSDDGLYKLRIRIYDASAAASEGIYNKERKLFGGRLLDDDKRMQIYRRGGALCVKMCGISRGWKTLDDSDENQVKFS